MAGNMPEAFKLLWFGRLGRDGGQDRAFLARLLVFQLSLARSTVNLLDLEYRRGLPDLTAIAADDSENLDGLWATHEQALLSRSVLELFVKEPLVDLDPRKSSGFDGMLTLLAVHFATVGLAMLI